MAPPPVVPAPPPAPAPAASDDEGRADTEDLQQARDRFEHYWNGQYEWWREENYAGRRKPHYTRLQVPKSRPPGQRPIRPDAPSLRVDGQRRPWRLPSRADPNNLQQYIAEVRNGKYNIMNFMRPLGFRLLKILGKGGFGMACLFEMTDVNGKKHQIVIKAGLARDLQRERRHLRVSLKWSFCRTKDAVLTFDVPNSGWQERDIFFSNKCYGDYLHQRALSHLPRERKTFSSETLLNSCNPSLITT